MLLHRTLVTVWMFLIPLSTPLLLLANVKCDLTHGFEHNCLTSFLLLGLFNVNVKEVSAEVT